MVGGRLRCLSCFLTCSSVLLLGVCLHGVDSSSCQRVIHKKVGDTVEFSSCLPIEGLTVASWIYGGLKIADKDDGVSTEDQFKGRVTLNLTDFSLTMRRLTLQDSGDFRFVSEVGGTQRETVTITLQVHASLEPIPQPVLTSTSTWNPLNESCTIFLECSATAGSNVTYNWSVRNQTTSGSRLQYIISAQDGDTRFTCTINSFASKMSASTTVKCNKEKINFVLLVSLAGGGCLFIVIVVGIAVGVCYCKQSHSGSDSNDLTVYADVSEFASENESSSTMKPCSVYETIDNRVNSVTPGPQTVYDKIQFSRGKKPSVSPYQDIS